MARVFPRADFHHLGWRPALHGGLFTEIAAMRGFNHHIVAPYSQWANGGVERLNKVIEDKLAAILNARGDPWTG